MASTYPLGEGDTTPGFVHELCKRLVARGHKVIVSTPHLPGAPTLQWMDGVQVTRYRYCPEFLEQLIGSGGIVNRVRERRWRLLLVPCLLFAMVLALRRACRQDSFDLVHAHWLIPQGLVAALAHGPIHHLPLLCTAHGGDLFALHGDRFRWLRRLIVARSAAVAVVSRYMRDVLAREGAASHKLHVASMGVDLRSHFVPVSSVIRDPRQVLFVGRLVEKKGVRHAIKAFSRVLQRHPDARLTIVGDGPERESLQELVHELELEEQVRLIGARPPADLPALYSAAAIAVVPSVIDRGGDQEGLGLVTIEAMGCGCAVVVSDLDAIRDVVSDGETGLVTRAGDETSLAAAIVRLLNEPALRHRLADAARSHALASFDWQAATERYERLYDYVKENPSR